MLRIILGKSKSILHWSAVPVVATTTTQNASNKAEAAKPENFVLDETGWDRVCDIFKPGQYVAISPDLQELSSMTSCFGLVGALLGSFIFSRHTYMHFMEHNHASRFESHLEAKAVLTDNMVNSMARGAFRWGGRLALISFTWVSVTRLVRAYRDENGFHNNIAGGLVTGTLAGYLFRDLEKMQIEKSFQRGRFLGGPLSVLGGAAVGCMIGGAIGAFDTFNKADSKSMRYWTKYWKAHEEEMRRKDPNYKPDN